MSIGLENKPEPGRNHRIAPKGLRAACVIARLRASSADGTHKLMRIIVAMVGKLMAFAAHAREQGLVTRDTAPDEKERGVRVVIPQNI